MSRGSTPSGQWPARVVVAPDSFKGSLDAGAVAAALAEGLQRVWPVTVIVRCPMADGGEGTLDAILAQGGRRRQATVTGADGSPVAAAFGMVGEGGTRVAILEVAQVVGITDAKGMSVPVEKRSSRGVGEIVRHALDAGAGEIMIGLGGSSTNDGGAGLLVGLGARLLAADGTVLAPTPEALSACVAVDLGGLDPRLAATKVTIMSDVNNPLCGDRGATAIFGPQKGVAPQQVPVIDEHIRRFADRLEAAVGRRARDNPGAGAAGGLGFMLQLLGGRFRSGAEVVADLVRLDDALAGAALLVTGEGRTDIQTLLGKTPFVAAQRARRRGTPAILVSGAIDRRALPDLASTFAGCFSLTFGPTTLGECMTDAARLLADSAEQIARLASAVRAGADP